MLILFFTGIVLITVLDQLTKLMAVRGLVEIVTIPLIEDIFHLTYCENKGAGFGVFSNHTWLLSIVTILIVAAAIVYVFVKRPKEKLLNVAVTFMIGGAVGNLIDRIRLGYVVDFLDFRWINFPIFNIADCFITVGAIILAVYVIFFSDKKEQTDGDNKSS